MFVRPAGGITESREICEDVFNALPYKDDCIGKTNIDIEESVTLCMEDVKV